MFRLLFYLIIALNFVGCGDDLTDVEKQINTIEELYQKLVTLSESEFCSIPDEWKAEPIGHKACGGPSSYLAYSIKIDTVMFLDLAKQHREESKILNDMMGNFSTCDYVPPPDRIACYNGKPIFLND